MNQNVGRNELCPCGSGKKYKQCCMNVKQPGLRLGGRTITAKVVSAGGIYKKTVGRAAK